MLLVQNGGRWPAKLFIVVAAGATSYRKAIYRSPLGVRTVEKISIQPPIAFDHQHLLVHHDNYSQSREIVVLLSLGAGAAYGLFHITFYRLLARGRDGKWKFKFPYNLGIAEW